MARVVKTIAAPIPIINQDNGFNNMATFNAITAAVTAAIAPAKMIKTSEFAPMKLNTLSITGAILSKAGSN